jgi:hypothetical protein
LYVKPMREIMTTEVMNSLATFSGCVLHLGFLTSGRLQR